MFAKFIVIGKVIFETETHYVTETPGGTASWSKAWYRLMAE